MVPSPTAAQLEQSLTAHVVPLLEPLGFVALGPPKRPRVGLVARTFGRALDSERSLVLSVWCDGGTALSLTWRLDVSDEVGNADLQLTFPYEVDGRPAARPCGGSHHALVEFRPHLDAAHLDRAIQSLACQLAMHAEEIAQQVPELGEALATAVASPAWQTAREIGP